MIDRLVVGVCLVLSMLGATPARQSGDVRHEHVAGLPSGRVLLADVIDRMAHQPRWEERLASTAVGYPSPHGYHQIIVFQAPDSEVFAANGGAPIYAPFGILWASSEATDCQHIETIWGCWTHSTDTTPRWNRTSLDQALLPPTDGTIDHVTYTLHHLASGLRLVMRAAGNAWACPPGVNGPCGGPDARRLSPQARTTLIVNIDATSLLPLSWYGSVKRTPTAHAQTDLKVTMSYSTQFTLAMPTGPHIACPAGESNRSFDYCIRFQQSPLDPTW